MPEGMMTLSLLEGWQVQFQVELVVQLPLLTAVLVAPNKPTRVITSRTQVPRSRFIIKLKNCPQTYFAFNFLKKHEVAYTHSCQVYYIKYYF
jgi:hypothetical protein